MKVACDECETIALEPAVGWISIERYGTPIQVYGVELEGRFCSTDCAIHRLQRIGSRRAAAGT